MQLSYRNSGLYFEPFFEKINIQIFNLQENWEDIEIPQFLIEKEFREVTNHPRKRIDFDNLNSADEETYYECKFSLLNAVLILNTVYQPIIFDEEIADLCGLIPFSIRTSYEDYELLALGGCGMNMAYKLEAYQLIVDGTCDKNSYFARDGINYLKTYYSENSPVIKEIKKIIEG